MPDYIYLLENRLSPAQQSALQSIREAARDAGMTVFLTGGAVRDLTSGSPVRDLDLSVQGKALDLKARLKAAGATIWGEHAPSQTLYARFPGSVRVEVSSTRIEEFPKPGKPVYRQGSILEDLRRRDFTVNAMALSLNEGSYGLLMDPLNGVADLEARLLRLVSNYGFIEDPVRMIRAVRLRTRLGWELEEKTKTRFDNAKDEGLAAQISAHQLGYEVEEIVHEEDGLKILKAFEADGWMKALFPAWTSAKADAEGLDALRELLVQLQMQGVNPDPSAAQAQMLTAKLPAKDVTALKKMFVRQGFVHEWETQDERAKEIAKRLISKEFAVPSATWKLLTSADPEAVLWLALTSKSAPVQARFKEFFSVWPEARQRIPYALMQEMRITPEIPGYQDLLMQIFFELIDGKLTTDEEMRAFLEPHSPPAPPPPVSIRRTRAKRSDRRAKEVDEDEQAASPRDDDEEVDLDEEAELGDERPELIARELPEIIPVPPVAPAAEATAREPESHAAVAEPAAVKPQIKSEPKPESHVPAKSKPEPAVKSQAVRDSKPTPIAAPAHPVKSAAKAASQNVPAKKAVKVVHSTPAKHPVKSHPTGKSVPKTASKPKPIAKKTAVKPAKGKTTAVLAKPKPAKAIVKPKPASLKVKPSSKVRPSSKPAPKKAAKTTPAKSKFKSTAKSLPAKKKR